MRQYLTATIQAMSQSELDEIVDPLTKEQIKRDDPNPDIRVYSIGHEGKADLHLPGIGNKTFTWIQAAIRVLAEKLRLGTAVFDRHDPDTNSHEGRVQIGQVVGKIVKKVGDRLNTLAAIHIFPQFKSRPLDIASFEAEIEFDHDEFQAWPTNIKNVSGIALSNSGIDNPGFPGATFLGVVQAYAVQAFGNDLGGNKVNSSEVKAAVRDLGLTPSSVFNIDVIMGDSAVVKKVAEAKQNVIAGSERITQERNAAREKIVELENQNAETNKKMQQHTVQSKSATTLDAVLADPERKLTDKAKIFIKRNHKNFSSAADNEDALKVDIGKFVDVSAQEFLELSTDVFGIKADKPPDKNTPFVLTPELTVDGQLQSPDALQSPANTTFNKEEILQEEMNPALNPLIPDGKAAKEALKT